MTRNVSSYIDRRTGRYREDPIYKHGLLEWLHNTRFGWFITRFFISSRIVSSAYGWMNKRAWSAAKIPRFVESMGVDMAESLRPVEAFKSFNDFITREIDLGRRPVAPEPDVCVAPADGRILAYPGVNNDTYFALKQCAFNLRTLLRDDVLADRFSKGALIISRLYLADYHHFHFPADGVAGFPTPITGRLYATTPYSRRWAVPYFAENRRVVTLLESDYFGCVAIIEVGAFTIGSIQQRFDPGKRVKKGDRKGVFELGGSVVALLFEPGRVVLDADLCDNTGNGLETYVRLGEPIGRAAG